jgi:DNA-binding transcriptional ArsR family regulator
LVKSLAPAKELTDTTLVRALKALSHPERFRMVREIGAAGELSCGQVAEQFDLSQPTMSHHLKLLADAGILVVRTEGKHHFLCVDLVVVARLSSLLVARLSPAKRAKETVAVRRPRIHLPNE